MYYTHTNGQLTQVYESANTNVGFKGRRATYTYDDNGNMISDSGKGITKITYNHLDLPRRIDLTNGRWILFTYDAQGNLLRRQTSTGQQQHYVHNVEYQTSGSTTKLEAIYTQYARLVPDYKASSTAAKYYRYEYSLSDHLGNVRATIADVNADGNIATNEILQQNHYYPYGMLQTGHAVNQIGTENPYQYNGIELVDDFGLDVSMAIYRTLDPAIVRWWQVDPKAEYLYHLSPYNTMNNNPVLYNDPNGDSPILVGAGIGLLSNGIQNIINGESFFKGAYQAAFFGAIGGGISSGIGTAAQGLADNGWTQLSVGLFQAGAHAGSGGLMSVAQGGNFWHGAAAGGISSATGSIIAAKDGSSLAQWIGGGISGGLGSWIAGGSFVDGATQGLITGGLNHAADEIAYLLTKEKLRQLAVKEGICNPCSDQEIEIWFETIVGRGFRHLQRFRGW